MIYPHSNATQTRGEHGNFKVQRNLLGNPRPMVPHDGSTADVSELQFIAEAEGSGSIRIEKRLLETRREIWTLGGEG
jgi:hypothetical protein